MVDIDDKIDKVLDVVDDNIESRQEAEATRTERLKLDMTSPFRLPQLIRPILAIWAMAAYTIIMVIGMYKGFVESYEVVGSITAILMTIIGFYFNSRKMEKTVAKRAEAAVQIEELKTKAEIKRDRREARHQRRLERIEARDK